VKTRFTKRDYAWFSGIVVTLLIMLRIACAMDTKEKPILNHEVIHNWNIEIKGEK
jgi:hypothetical protein